MVAADPVTEIEVEAEVMAVDSDYEVDSPWFWRLCFEFSVQASIVVQTYSIGGFSSAGRLEACCAGFP